MNQVKFCLFASLAVSCLVQSVLSVPMIIDGILDYDINLPVADDMTELKELKEVYDPSLLLNRFRRNVAQWSVGSHHFNDYNHEAGQRRFGNRRFNTRHQGGGQIVDA